MTRKEIDDIFQEYGQYATGKDYALVHAIAEAVVAQKCVCGEPNSSGTHRTDGPCLAPQPSHEPVAKVSKRYVNNIQWLNEVPEFDTLLYTTPPQRKPLPKGEWPKHPSGYVGDVYKEYDKSDLDNYAMQVLAAHGIKE